MSSLPISPRSTALQADLRDKLNNLPNDVPIIQLLKEMLINTNVAIFNHFECLFESYKQTVLNDLPNHSSYYQNEFYNTFNRVEEGVVGDHHLLTSPNNEFVVPVIQKHQKRMFDAVDGNNENIIKNRRVEQYVMQHLENEGTHIKQFTNQHLQPTSVCKSPRNEKFFTPRAHTETTTTSTNAVHSKSSRHAIAIREINSCRLPLIPELHRLHQSEPPSCDAALTDVDVNRDGCDGRTTLSGDDQSCDMTSSEGGIYCHYVLRPIPPPDPKNTLPLMDFLVYKKEKQKMIEDVGILKRDRQLFMYTLDVRQTCKYNNLDFDRPSTNMRVQWVKDLSPTKMEEQDEWNPLSIFGSAPPAVDTSELFPLKLYNQISAADRMKHPAIRFERLENEWKKRTGKVIRLKMEELQVAEKVYALIEKFHREKNTVEQWMSWFGRSIDGGEWNRIYKRLESAWNRDDEMDLNWRHDRLSRVEIRWLSYVMGWKINKRSEVAEIQPCFCPAPNPASKWGWNDRRHALQNTTKSRTSESLWGPNLSLHRMGSSFKSPAKTLGLSPNPFKSPFKF